MNEKKTDRYPIYGIEDGKRVAYIPNRIFEYRKELTVSARVIYMELIFQCSKNKTYETYLTDKELAGICTLSVSTIKRALSGLEKYNFIKKERIGRKRKITLLDY